MRSLLFACISPCVFLCTCCDGGGGCVYVSALLVGKGVLFTPRPLPCLLCPVPPLSAYHWGFTFWVTCACCCCSLGQRPTHMHFTLAPPTALGRNLRRGSGGALHAHARAHVVGLPPPACARACVRASLPVRQLRPAAARGARVGCVPLNSNVRPRQCVVGCMRAVSSNSLGDCANPLPTPACGWINSVMLCTCSNAS